MNRSATPPEGEVFITEAVTVDCDATASFKALPVPSATPVPTLGEGALLLGTLLAGLGVRRLGDARA